MKILTDAVSEHDTAVAMARLLPSFEDMGDNPRSATIQALAAAGRSGEAPELIWLTAAPGAEEAVLAGVEDVVGRQVRIVGGSAADNDVAGDWFVFDHSQTAQNGVVVSVLFPSTDCQSTYQSGYAPAGRAGVVTRATGRCLFEIDHRPAREVYTEWTGNTVAPQTPLAAQHILADSTFWPLGRKDTAVTDVAFYLLAHPATVHPDDSLELFADVEVGEDIHLMTGGIKSLTSRAARVAAQSTEMATKSEIDLGTSVQEAFDLLRAGVPMKINLTLDLPAETISVAADPTDLIQIIINLGINAHEPSVSRQVALPLRWMQCAPPPKKT